MFVRVLLRMYECISSVRVYVVAHAIACIYALTTGVRAQLCESMMYIVYACVFCVCASV